MSPEFTVSMQLLQPAGPLKSVRRRRGKRCGPVSTVPLRECGRLRLGRRTHYPQHLRALSNCSDSSSESAGAGIVEDVSCEGASWGYCSDEDDDADLDEARRGTHVHVHACCCAHERIRACHTQCCFLAPSTRARTGQLPPSIRGARAARRGHGGGSG